MLCLQQEIWVQDMSQILNISENIQSKEALIITHIS